jgi:hypothetical protein
MDEIRFHPVRADAGNTERRQGYAPLSSCRLCAAVIVDDDEGANRGDHVAQHERVDELERLVRALIDGKRDT